MAKTSRSVGRWLALGLGAVAVWQLGSLLVGQRSGPDKLVNQFWIERAPNGPRDMVWHLVAVEHEGHRLGGLGRSSRWRVESDGFVWKVEGDRFTFVTPQNGCRSTLKARTWKCAGEAPKPFELCLELEGHGKRYRYYSREDWVIRPGGQLAAEAPVALPALRSASETPEVETIAARPAQDDPTCAPSGP